MSASRQAGKSTSAAPRGAGNFTAFAQRLVSKTLQKENSLRHALWLLLLPLVWACASDGFVEARRRAIAKSNSSEGNEKRRERFREELRGTFREQITKTRNEGATPVAVARLTAYFVKSLHEVNRPLIPGVAREEVGPVFEMLTASMENNPDDRALLLANRAFLHFALGQSSDGSLDVAESFRSRPTLMVTLWLINGRGAENRKEVATTCSAALPFIVDEDERFSLLAGCEFEAHTLDTEAALQWASSDDRKWYRQEIKGRRASHDAAVAHEHEEQVRLRVAYLQAAAARDQAESARDQAESARAQASSMKDVAAAQRDAASATSRQTEIMRQSADREDCITRAFASGIRPYGCY